MNPFGGCNTEVNRCRIFLIFFQNFQFDFQIFYLLLQFRHLLENFSRKKNRIFNIFYQTLTDLCGNTTAYPIDRSNCTKKLDNLINIISWSQFKKWSSFLYINVAIWNRNLVVVVVGIVDFQWFELTYRCWPISLLRGKHCQPPISKNLRRVWKKENTCTLFHSSSN